MANNTEEVSWPYENNPKLGLKIRSLSGNEYPENNETIVLIDTGYDGEVILPLTIYHNLNLNLWEEPEKDEFMTPEGKDIDFLVSRGYIIIPKLGNNQYPVEIHTASDRTQDIGEVIVGIKFIKRFKLLLDGPASKVMIL